jgi:hypothetical protein
LNDSDPTPYSPANEDADQGEHQRKGADPVDQLLDRPGTWGGVEI